MLTRDLSKVIKSSYLQSHSIYVMGDSLILDLAVFKDTSNKSNEDKDQLIATYILCLNSTAVLKRVFDCKRLTVPVNHL